MTYLVMFITLIRSIYLYHSLFFACHIYIHTIALLPSIHHHAKQLSMQDTLSHMHFLYSLRPAWFCTLHSLILPTYKTHIYHCITSTYMSSHKQLSMQDTLKYAHFLYSLRHAWFCSLRSKILSTYTMHTLYNSLYLRHHTKQLSMQD